MQQEENRWDGKREPKRVLVVSDTHGRIANLQEVWKRFDFLDLTIHLGDLEGGEQLLRKLAPCPMEIVAGNNDYFTQLPQNRVIKLGKYRIFLTHGHRYHVHYGNDVLIEEARLRDCQIAMYGHTHSPEIRHYPGITVLNPGSITCPRPATKPPSYILIDFDRDGEAHFTICTL
ncbi:MAG: metallophosphoesterase [Lachnospiraceae bacterium]|nr:metallophosphoesterase [Lachnospiraceae bacterium]